VLPLNSVKSLAIASVLLCAIGFLSTYELSAQLDDYTKLTTFTKERTWESAQGTSITGRLVSLGLKDEVEIFVASKSASINLRLGQLSQADQQFIEKFRVKAYEGARKESRKLSTALAVHVLYEKLFDDGLVPLEKRNQFKLEIEELERQAAAKSIKVSGGFIKPQELEARKQEAKKLIDDWVDESNRYYKSLKKSEPLETKLVKSAIQKDPTSVEGIVLLSLLYGLRESDLDAEERKLVDALEVGERFSNISSKHDRYNIAGAYNNLAVNCCRQNQVNKALRYWTIAADFSDASIDKTIGENLVRLLEFTQNISGKKKKKNNTGLSATLKELKRAEELQVVFNPVSTTGGWKLVVPKDINGEVRTNMPFILAAQTAFKASLISDSRCLRCFGLGRTRCPNRPCKRGKIPVEILRDQYITLPNGKRKHIGKAVAGIRWDPCPVCRGDEVGMVKCPTCRGKGKQE